MTRGDVQLEPILTSLVALGERLVWDNSDHPFALADWIPGAVVLGPRVRDGHHDVAVYGRYAAAEHAASDLIYVQDDDCVLTPEAVAELIAAHKPGHVVCNMPPSWRDQPFYRDHALVGFGAVFDRHLPAEAFERLAPILGREAAKDPDGDGLVQLFYRTCDVAFTALTPRILVDVPYVNLPHATAPGRMYRQPKHVSERSRMLRYALEARDA